MDKKKMLPGVDWEEEIISAIEDSRFVIIILSKHSVNKNGFVQKEIREALARFSGK